MATGNHRRNPVIDPLAGPLDPKGAAGPAAGEFLDQVKRTGQYMVGRYRHQRRNVQPPRQTPKRRDIGAAGGVLGVEQDGTTVLQVFVDPGLGGLGGEDAVDRHRPIQKRKERQFVAARVDPLRRTQFGRGSAFEDGVEPAQASAAGVVDLAVSGYDIGEPGFQRVAQSEGIGASMVSGPGHASHTRHHRQRQPRHRAGPGTEKQQPPKAQAGGEINQRQHQGQGQQPGPEIDFLGLAVFGPGNTAGQRPDGDGRCQTRRQVERPSGRFRSIIAGRVRLRYPGFPECLGGDGPGAGDGRPQSPKTVESGKRVQWRTGGLGDDALAECHQAPQHVNEQTGKRQVRPLGVGGGVDQHQPALAAPFPGHQRRAVIEAGPGFLRQVEGRLGQHLTFDGHVVRNGKAVEGAGGLERRQLRRLAPRHGAADDPVPLAQAHRQKWARSIPGSFPVPVVTGFLGQQRPGEPDGGAPGPDPVFQGLAHGFSQLPGIGQHGDRQRPFQKVFQAAVADFGERVKGALQVIKVAQQRLIPGGAGPGNQPHRTAAPTLVGQNHGPGGAGVFDLETLQPVQQLRRQRQADLGTGFAGGEGQRFTGQQPPVLAKSPDPDRRHALRRRPFGNQVQGSSLGAGRAQHRGQTGQGIADDGDPAQSL